ncbi:MAG: hypothetical protein LBI94_08940 [Treponema sp.]|jgi:hypothetical protein|nr:hypothetical protein [Treponema sp.]
MMKAKDAARFLGIFCALAPLAALVSCAGSPAGNGAPAGTIEGTGAEAPKTANNIERIRVDYQGAVTGSEIPAWVQSAIDFDTVSLQKLPEFEGKIVVVDYGVGQNLELLRSLVNNFNVQGTVARRITNYVEANFGGEQLGDKNTAENRSFVEEVVAAFSRVEINGLAREKEYWVKLRTIDRGKKTENEQYYYYVLYSIPEQLLNEQISRAMENIPAQTRDQQELRSSVEDAMKRAAYNSVDEGRS